MYLFSTSLTKTSSICLFFFCLLNLTFLAFRGQAQESSSDAFEVSTAHYRVTFQSVWSNSTHPGAYPSSAHYSGLIGMTHNANIKLFELGELASAGIIAMAEFGSKSGLRTEVQAAISAGTGQHLISGGALGTSPGSVSVEIDIEMTHPLVSITSMIAPSPDWFIGVRNINLVADGDWVNQLSIPVGVYDSGSDSGINFTSSNQPTTPKVPIAMITTAPLAVNGVVANMGNMIFERIDGGNECVTNRVVTDNVAAGNYNASQIITTSINNPVEVSTTATFSAGESITLQEGFHAKQGSIFSALIENCANNLNAENPIIESRSLVITPPKTPFAPFTQTATLTVYPNPFSHNSSIQFSLPSTSNISIQLMDSNGRLVQYLATNVIKDAGVHQIRLDASPLNSGIYFIRLVTDMGVLTERVVLQR